jgi:hypothetical protein
MADMRSSSPHLGVASLASPTHGMGMVGSAPTTPLQGVHHGHANFGYHSRHDSIGSSIGGTGTAGILQGVTAAGLTATPGGGGTRTVSSGAAEVLAQMVSDVPAARRLRKPHEIPD